MMNNMTAYGKAAAVFLAAVVALSGCTKVSQKAGALWDSITGDSKEGKVETRDEAIARLEYKGPKDAIFLDAPVVSPQTVARGGSLKQEFRYSVLSPDAAKVFSVTEVIVLSGEGLRLELSRTEKERPQGTHSSEFQFALPKDIMPGEYQLTTSVKTGSESRTASAGFRVKR